MCFLIALLILHVTAYGDLPEKFSKNCTLYAKNVAKLTSSQTKTLCQFDDVSVIRPKCVGHIPLKLRDSVGISLCHTATSILPAYCFMNVSHLISIPQESSVVIEFCKNMTESNQIALSCAKYALELYVKLNQRLVTAQRIDFINSILLSCQRTISERQTSTCINEMTNITSTKSQLKEISLSNIVSFCTCSRQSVESVDNIFIDTSSSQSNDILLSSSSLFSMSSDLSSPLATCFLAGKMLRLHSGKSLDPSQLFSLCQYSPKAFKTQQHNKTAVMIGPIMCAERLLNRTNRIGSVNSNSINVKNIPIATVLDTCQGAASTGPAECLYVALSSRNSAKFDDTLINQLCSQSFGKHPVECFNQVERYLGRNLSIELCRGATDESRATCVSLAPNYLNSFEKVQLCRSMGVNIFNAKETIREQQNDALKSSSSVDCLQSLRSSCIRLNSLLFLDNANQPESRRQEKSLLLDLCASTSTPSSPTLSLSKVRSECLKKATCDNGRSPHTNARFNSLDYAVSVCKQAMVEDAVALVTACIEMLPQSFIRANSTLSEIVCMHVENLTQSVAVQICVTKLLQNKIPFTMSTIAILCGQSSELSSAVIECVSAAQRPGTTSLTATNLYLTTSIVSRACTAHEPRDAILIKREIYNATLAGMCLADIIANAASSSSVTLNEDATVFLCKYHASQRLRILICLNHRHPYQKSAVTWRDVDTCVRTVAVASGVKVLSFVGQRGEPFVTAGESFSIYFQVLDQFQRPLITTDSAMYHDSIIENNEDKEEDKEEVWLSCTLDHGMISDDTFNKDAVIWGHKPNRTSLDDGRSHVTLAISQAGIVRLIISAYSRVYHSSSSSTTATTGLGRRVVLGVFTVTVRADPTRVADKDCMFIFHRGLCPLIYLNNNNNSTSAADIQLQLSDSEEDIENSSTQSATMMEDTDRDLEQIRNLVHSNFYSITTCASTFQRWGISVTAAITTTTTTTGVSFNSLPSSICSGNSGHNYDDDYYSISYRRGIDSIWTGVGLPSEYMSAPEILSLSSSSSSSSQSFSSSWYKISGTEKSKERLLKKAYHSLSKLWHPDRWTRYPSMYIPIVQSAFYYVHQAYESLMIEIKINYSVSNHNTDVTRIQQSEDIILV